MLALSLLWVGISWYWYTCGIKGFCQDKTLNKPIVQVVERRIPVKVERQEKVCQPYIIEKMSLTRVNDPEEVKKLKTFLYDHEGFETLKKDGVFNKNTDSAVRIFQNRYANDILVPAGLDQPSGNVYKYTIRKINALYCDSNK